MAIVWPAFALVALTLFSVARLARMRFAAARDGRVDPRYYKVFKGEGEPPELAAASRNVINLYEMPTLFYAGTAIAFAAGESGPVLVALGWAYVGLRALHSGNSREYESSDVAVPGLLRELGRAARVLGRTRRRDRQSRSRGLTRAATPRCGRPFSSAWSWRAPSGRSHC